MCLGWAGYNCTGEAAPSRRLLPVIVNFPPGYPDELFYSMCARYRHRFGYRDGVHLAQALFGKAVSPGILLPDYLGALARRLPGSSSLSARRLIWEHTAYPTFAPFLDQDRVVRIYQSMDSARDSGTHLGGLWPVLADTKCLRYCPKRVADDLGSC